MSENEKALETSEEVEVAAETTVIENEGETPVVENNEVVSVETTAVADSAEAPAVATAQVNSAPSMGQKIAAGIKEWFRKFTVKLKHKPQNIPFVILLVTSFMYLCFLGTFSKFIVGNSSIKSLGIFQFVNTLASILIILIFLNSFPKRKKPNIVMLVLTFAVLALMIVMDTLFIVNVVDYGNGLRRGLEWFLEQDGVSESINCCIVHIVFLAITILMLALLPVYKKLLMKINTSKELASNNINEELDTSEEDG